MNLTENTISSFRLKRWAELPAIELYMDQLVIVLQEGVGIFVEDKDNVVTRSMINNYVKQKLISAPEKKKYGKKHIAALTVVNILKKVFAMSEITAIIKLIIDAYGMEAGYDLFCERLERAMQNALCDKSAALIEAVPSGDTVAVVLDSAITAFVSKLLVINSLPQEKKP